MEPLDLVLSGRFTWPFHFPAAITLSARRTAASTAAFIPLYRCSRLHHGSPGFWRHNFNFGATTKPLPPLRKVQYGPLDMPGNKKVKMPLWGILSLRGLFINPHINRSILYLHWSRRFCGSPKIKVTSSEACRPMVCTHPSVCPSRVPPSIPSHICLLLPSFQGDGTTRAFEVVLPSVRTSLLPILNY